MPDVRKVKTLAPLEKNEGNAIPRDVASPEQIEQIQAGMSGSAKTLGNTGVSGLAEGLKDAAQNMADTLKESVHVGAKTLDSMPKYGSISSSGVEHHMHGPAPDPEPEPMPEPEIPTYSDHSMDNVSLDDVDKQDSPVPTSEPTMEPERGASVEKRGEEAWLNEISEAANHQASASLSLDQPQ